MATSTVLLVEDNPDDEQLILRALKQTGISDTIEVARNGREAVDYLLGVATPPRLVMLDLKLPKMGGLEVLQALRLDNKTRMIPVVVFTSSIEKTDVLTSYDLGANSYIRKPVDYRQLTDVVKLIVSYWLQTNVAPPTER
ncbi:MAG: response regulator [Gammaproteobacteria bacterium]|nr:response regulator [Gammaproteobacteria bacterium]